MKGLGRREFLRWFALAGTGTLAAACAPKVVEKIVKETVVVEKEVVKEVAKEVKVKETVIVAGTPKTVEKVVTTTPAAKLGGELDIWWYPWTEDDMGVVFEPLHALFNKEYPDIKVNLDIQPWGGRREKLYASFAANEAPDMWYANSDTLPAYVQKGVALDLDEVLSPDDLAVHDEGALNAGVYKGKRVMFNCFPFTGGKVYNGTLMTECGVDPEVGVTTWQDVYDLAEVAKGKGWYVDAINTLSWGWWVIYVHMAGGQVFSDDGTKVDMTQEACVDTLAHFVKMFQSDYVPLEGAVATPEQGAGIPNYFQQQIQLIEGANENSCADYYRQWPDFPWVIGKPLQRKAGDPLTSGNYSGAGWSVVAKAKHMEQAIAYIRWAVQPVNLGLLCTLLSTPAPGGEAWKYLKLAECSQAWADKMRPYAFVNNDLYTLWQESKTITAPHFQGAILDQETVEEALEKSQEEMQTRLDEVLAAEA